MFPLGTFILILKVILITYHSWLAFNTTTFVIFFLFLLLHCAVRIPFPNRQPLPREHPSLFSLPFRHSKLLGASYSHRHSWFLRSCDFLHKIGPITILKSWEEREAHGMGMSVLQAIHVIWMALWNMITIFVYRGIYHPSKGNFFVLV